MTGVRSPSPETLEPRWSGTVIVAATGKSLTLKVARACEASGHPTIAIKQAAERMPWAAALYAPSVWHWEQYKAWPAFQGERWVWLNQRRIEAVAGYAMRYVRGEFNKAPARLSVDPATSTRTSAPGCRRSAWRGTGSVERAGSCW